MKLDLGPRRLVSMGLGECTRECVLGLRHRMQSDIVRLFSFPDMLRLHIELMRVVWPGSLYGALRQIPALIKDRQ